MSDKTRNISVLLVTFNHQKHIRQALDALIEQRFDGTIELVVADDKSTDDTLTIIREYEGKDPRFAFKYLDYSENLGITKNYKRGFAACTGEYVAVLEGDDYWTSPLKLQRQAEFLRDHWESDLCSVNYFVYVEDSAQISARVAASQGYRLISARELIADNIVGNFSTCMYRRTALTRIPDKLFDIKSYDWITNIVIAKSTLIGFLEEPMSVYRLHGGGVWTQTPHIEKLKAQLDLLPAYDELTEFVFHDDFEKLGTHLRHVIKVSQIGHVTEAVSQPVLRAVPAFVRYTPPIILMMLKLIVPVAVKDLLSRVLNRSRSR